MTYERPGSQSGSQRSIDAIAHNFSPSNLSWNDCYGFTCLYRCQPRTASAHSAHSRVGLPDGALGGLQHGHLAGGALGQELGGGVVLAQHKLRALHGHAVVGGRDQALELAEVSRVAVQLDGHLRRRVAVVTKLFCGQRIGPEGIASIEEALKLQRRRDDARPRGLITATPSLVEGGAAVLSAALLDEKFPECWIVPRDKTKHNRFASPSARARAAAARLTFEGSLVCAPQATVPVSRAIEGEWPRRRIKEFAGVEFKQSISMSINAASDVHHGITFISLLGNALRAGNHS